MKPDCGCFLDAARLLRRGFWNRRIAAARLRGRIRSSYMYSLHTLKRLSALGAELKIFLSHITAVCAAADGRIICMITVEMQIVWIDGIYFPDFDGMAEIGA